MPIARSTRTLAPVVTGLAVLAALGCSSQSERPARLETAASLSTPADSVVPTTDTSLVAQNPETSAPALPATHAPVGHPARMPKAGATRPASVKPARDTSAAAQPRAEPAVDPAAATSDAGQDKWLSYDAATNTVTFELIAGPFTFNGYRNGEGTLVVPPKANIVMNFINKDGTPHSAIIIPGEGPIPNSASTPAIQRAYTIQVLQGLPQEGTDVMRFPVPESGTYRIFCGVPGHGLSGMWIWMKIDPAAKAPSFGPTKP